MTKLWISGFADEIANDFRKQLETVTGLGMRYISLRSAYGKNIADYSLSEIEESIVPLLEEFGVRVSSLGSPIGKIGLHDKPAMEKQMMQLRELCRIAKRLNCRYIRVFSFYLPENERPEEAEAEVTAALRRFIAEAEAADIVLIHENEKDIYGDNLARNYSLMKTLGGEHFGLAFDFANFVQVGEDTLACWEALKDYVRYIHIKDAVASSRENVVFGTGEGQVREILDRAIRRDGYTGFLTLEPHLVLFDSLQSLELEQAHNIIKVDKAKDGASAYAMQYNALVNILKDLKVCYAQQ